MFELLSRSDAIARGSVRYFTGKPCRHGHIAERLVSNSMCVVRTKYHARGYAKLNPEKVQASRRAARDRDPDKAKAQERASRLKRKDKQRIAHREWKLRNPDRVKARAAEYRARRPDVVRESNTKWREANSERVRAYCLNRIARKAAADGSYTAEDVETIAAAQKNRCAYCRRRLSVRTRSVDHIMALSKGGTNFPSNLQIVCGPCNSSKGARDPIDFSQSLGMLV